MTADIRPSVLAPVTTAALCACDRVPWAPTMNPADLSDDRGAKAGRFRSFADDAADGKKAAAAAIGNESTQ